jgi:tRNA(fMet)-specific endonuclease VapC
VEAVLGVFDVLPFEADADRHYATIRYALGRKGVAIGANNLLIAAHVRAAEAVCVRANLAEFRRVPGLRVENWL